MNSSGSAMWTTMLLIVTQTWSASLTGLSFIFIIKEPRVVVVSIVASIQTFGQKINPHPHLHCLVTEGGEESKVSYRYEKDAEEVERMDYLEFIARVTSHIPDMGQVTIRYFGLYANAHRGKYGRKDKKATSS